MGLMGGDTNEKSVDEGGLAAGRRANEDGGGHAERLEVLGLGAARGSLLLTRSGGGGGRGRGGGAAVGGLSRGGGELRWRL